MSTGVRPQKISTCVDYCRDILLGHLGVRPKKISTCVDSDVVHVHHVVGVRPYKISTCVDDWRDERVQKRDVKHIKFLLM